MLSFPPLPQVLHIPTPQMGFPGAAAASTVGREGEKTGAPFLPLLRQGPHCILISASSHGGEGVRVRVRNRQGTAGELCAVLGEKEA